jgi:uncharacterized membrane protein
MTRKNLGPEEAAKLDAIEALVTSLREEAGAAPDPLPAIAADRVARIVGSWKFILGMGSFITAYISYNLFSVAPFDNFPFILLNLFLSFQAAIFLPIILMSQNRADTKDRKHATRAYRTIGHIEELVKLLADMEGVDQPEPPVDISNGSS